MIMTMMPTLWGTYLIGFIVFYLFEIQDTEKFGDLYASTIDRHRSTPLEREHERQTAKMIYSVVVLVGAIVWPIWMVRQLVERVGE